MPKAKKLRAPAMESQQGRHEPLGQSIEGDQLRGKYAAPSRGRRKRNNEQGNGTKIDDEYLDDKTSKRILDMSREQQLEEEIDEQRKQQQNHSYQHNERSRQSKNNNAYDSDEADVDVEEIVVEEDEE